jgi:VWFA-related protein
MRRPRTRIAGLSIFVVATTLVARTPAQTQTPPTFLAGTDLVSVAVTVLTAGQPVGALTAADFALTDNGIPQHIDAVDATAMPLDVTLIADLSGQTASAWSSTTSPAHNQALLRNNLATVARILRPDDRLRVLIVDTYVSEAVPMQAPAMPLDLGRPPAGGLSSVYDALATAMMYPVEPGRRHVIVAWTKPLDTVSSIDAAVVRDVARRSDASVHIGLRDVGSATGPALTYQVFERSWRPVTRNDLSVLTDVAALTGGSVHSAGVLSEATAVEVLTPIVSTLRHGYVLRYRPERVSRGGWHDIAVKVPRLPSAEVRARRGYAGVVAPPAPAGTGTAADLVSSTPTVLELARGADLSNPPGTRAALRRISDLRRAIRDYRTAGSTLPAHPKQEAAFVLALAQAGLFGRDAATRDEALSLLAQAHDLVRQPLGADDFECRWYEAEVALYEGSLLAGQAMDAANHALERCPNDGVLRLGIALASDQLWSTDRARTNASRATRATVTDAASVMAKYDAAAEAPEVAAEARVRSAWLAYRTGDVADALDRLDRADQETADLVVQFLSRFVRGRALYARGDRTAARDAYRSALEAWPGAQSARVALMTLLVTSGDRLGAESLAEAVQTAADAAIDPWWVYWQGDYRRFDGLMAALAGSGR